MRASTIPPDRARRSGAWRLTLALLALLAAAPAPAPATSGELDEIRQLADRGRREEALRRLEDALVRDPSQLAGRFLRGVLLVELDRTAEAERVFEELVREHPERPEPINNLAVLRAASGRRALAISALEEVVRDFPSYQAARHNLEIVRGLGDRPFDPMAEGAERPNLWLSSDPGELTRGEPAPEPTADAPAIAEPEGRPAPEPEIPAPGPAPPAPPEPLEEPPRPAPEPAAAESPAQAIDPVTGAPLTPVEMPADDGAELPVGGGARPELERVVTAWASAWARQSVREYLDFYSAGFRPTGFPSRDAWETARRQRVAAPQFIEVEIDLETLTLDEPAPGVAVVTFTQRYRSDRYSDTVRKRLELAIEDGSWRIRREDSD